MSEQPNNDATLVQELVELGSDISGDLAGGTIGFLLAGPVGLAAGAVAGPLATRLVRLGADFMQRRMSPREQQRVGATISFAAEAIQQKINEGLTIRNDGFFNEHPGQRAAATEIAEGILAVAARQYEEQKLRLLANLLANIGFHSEVDAPWAYQMVRQAERLSYRQLALIALLEHKEAFGLAQQEFISRSELTGSGQGLMLEVYDLVQQGLIPVTYNVIDGPSRVISPHDLHLTELGQTLYNMMQLWEIDPEYRVRLARLYRSYL